MLSSERARNRETERSIPHNCLIFYPALILVPSAVCGHFFLRWPLSAVSADHCGLRALRCPLSMAIVSRCQWAAVTIVKAE
ncbi:hypothetical protein ACTXT7_005691 [Hymenolepis weldensis]